MWVLRKLNPWQDQTVLYDANYAVYYNPNKADALRQKREFELEQIRLNPLPNFFEYWDVVRDKELIDLHNYLVKKHDFKILNVEGVLDYRALETDEVLHGIYPDARFSDDDLMAIQDFVGVYYYKLDFITEKDKYFLMATPNYYELEENNLTFKLYNSEAEAAAAKVQLWLEEEIILAKT